MTSILMGPGGLVEAAKAGGESVPSENLRLLYTGRSTGTSFSWTLKWHCVLNKERAQRFVVLQQERTTLQYCSIYRLYAGSEGAML